MSELTTIARPYAKAAFEFAVEHKAVDQWLEMLDFAAQVAENETMHSLVNGSVAAEELAKLFVGVCGEQLNEHGQNLIVSGTSTDLAAGSTVTVTINGKDYSASVLADGTWQAAVPAGR